MILTPKYFGGLRNRADLETVTAFSLQFSYSNQIGPPASVGISAGQMANIILPDDLLANRWQKPGDITASIQDSFHWR